ncbi:MAG: ROK family protein [Actinobacteria bacterium]|nr:ROK family protein [Actinomycetota bacterium]
MTSLLMDLGGTRVKTGVIDGDRLLIRGVYEIGDEKLVEAIARIGEQVLDGDAPDEAAMCVPGLVNDDGVLVSLPGKHDGLEGTNIAELLQELFDVERALVTNDAIAYATGESTAGAGRGAARAVVVTIGTGVGVAVIEDGIPVTGGIYGGGILGGFIPITDDTGDLDTSGQRGTIEALCAARRIVECCGGLYSTVPEVYDAYEREEPAAIAGVERYRARLVRALVALASAHAPDVIILGGGPMTPGNPVTNGVEPLVNEHLFGSYRTEVRVAELGDEAAIVGLGHLLVASA